MPVRPFARSRRPALGLVAAALFLGGCDLSTEESGPSLFGEFSPQEIQPPPIAPPTVVAQGGLRFLTVGGTIIFPCAEASRAANFRVDEQVVTIRLTITPAGPNCDGDPPFGVDYRINLISLAGGTYEVRMIHDGDLGAPDGTEVLRQTVTVTSPAGG